MTQIQIADILGSEDGAREICYDYVRISAFRAHKSLAAPDPAVAWNFKTVKQARKQEESRRWQKKKE